MAKIKYIAQSEHSECGLACVASILQYYGYKISLPKLREKYGVPKNGYNLLQLQQILGDFQVESIGIRVKDIHILKKSKFILLAYMNNKHFVIMAKVRRGKVLLVDPARGKMWIDETEFIDNFSEKALRISSLENLKAIDYNGSNHLLLQMIKRNKGKIGIIVGLTLAMQMLSLVIPLIMQLIIDNLIITLEDDKIKYIGSGISVFCLGYFILSFIRGYGITKMQIIFDRELMETLINHILKLPYKFFSNRSSGELIFRLNSNVYLRQILSQSFISIFADTFLTIVYLLLMVYYSKVLTFITLGISIFLVITAFIYAKLIFKISEEEMIKLTNTQKIMSEMVNGMITIKAIGAEKEFYKDWHEKYIEQLVYLKKKGFVSAVLMNVSNVVQMIFPLLFIILAYRQIIEGSLSLGTTIAFSSLALAFIKPITVLSNTYSEIKTSQIYFERLNDILDSEIEESSQIVFKIDKGNIRIHEMSFAYNCFDEKILKNINITIQSGEKIAIVGKSGSGKSTLLKLIMGLYKPNHGTIFIDDVDIFTVDRDQLRNQMGIVLQESQLFNKSIRDNILFGRDNISEEQLIEALQKAGLFELVFHSAKGVEAMISENGVNYSGGQRQRLSLARALLNHPKVLLMDEPTSFLDNESELNFMQQILKLESTCIVVSHRLSCIDRFDRIIVMEDGMIVQMGTHEKLVSEINEVYHSLYNSQIDF